MAEHNLDRHSEHDHSEDHHDGHHYGIPWYLVVFGVLVVGTILTWVTALYDLDVLFPGANTLLALIIAFTKMSFVVLYFMHVRYSSRLIWLMVVSGFFWLAIMFAFTMQDYLTRGIGLFPR